VNQKVDAILLLGFAAMAILLALALGGCSLRQPYARTYRAVSTDPALAAWCQSLNRRVIGFTATSVGLGAAGGATGLSSIFTGSTNRYATAGTSVGLAILAPIFAYLSNVESQAYTRSCTAETTSVP
jgi:hypothetical protein